MRGDVKDPTGGATNFYAPALMKDRGQPEGPTWAKGQTPTVTIGGHAFYKLPYGGSGTTSTAAAPAAPAAPSKGDTRTPPSIQIGGTPPAPPGAPAATTAPPPQGFGRVIAGTEGVTGPEQVTVALPPSGKGSPLPAGKLQTTGKPPGVAAADVIQSGREMAAATPVIKGTGQEAGPSGAVATLATPDTGWGAKPAPSYGFGPGDAAAQPPPTPSTPPAPTTQPTPPAKMTPEGVPDTLQEFRRQHQDLLTPNADERKLFSQDPDPAQLANIQQQRAIAQQRIDEANAEGRAGEQLRITNPQAGQQAIDAATQKRAQAQADLTKAITDENKMRQDAAKQGSDAQAKWYTDRDKMIQDQFNKAQDAKQTRLTNKAQLQNQHAEGILDEMRKDTIAAGDKVSDLQLLREMSQNLGDPNWLTIASARYPQLANMIAASGMVPDSWKDQIGRQQMFRSSVANVIKTLRSGMSMGNLSDRDLDFIRDMAPNELENANTRDAVTAFLLKSARAKQDFFNTVRLRYAKSGDLDQAITDAQTEREGKPLVPQLPARLARSDADPNEVRQWFTDSGLKDGELMHDARGNLVVWHRVGKPSVAPAPSPSPARVPF